MSAAEMSTYHKARELIDAAHRKDPAFLARTTHSEQPSTSSDGGEKEHTQDELAYADAVEDWAMKLLETDPNASVLTNGPGGVSLIRLAARCQHLERFLTPRSSFPDGKVGYLKWRKALYVIQADRARELLAQAGICQEEQIMVRRWVSKTDLKPGKDDCDPGSQLLEDAAVLVFLQDQLAGFALQHQDYTKAKYIGILAKTWKKLSANAKSAALSIQMDPALKAIVVEAIAEVEEKDAAAAAREEQRQQARSDQAAADKGTEIASDQRNPAKKTSSVREYHVQRPKTVQEAEQMLADATDPSAASVFGSRLLKKGDDYLSHNAWDHVEPPAEYQSMVDELLAKQAETKVSLDEADTKYHANAASHWDAFYSQHEHRFFKDRRWLHLEFPELLDLTEADAGSRSVFEIGCGAGNTVFPLLEKNKNPDLTIFACDYSAEAVQVVRNNAMYKAPAVGKARAFVWDLSSPQGMPNDEIEPASLDIVVLIFVLSALHPREWQQAVDNVHAMLKPGGLVLVRDYGRHDLPQLRFRQGRMLDDNFYVRGDGTRVYFFTPEELLQIFNASPPPSSGDPMPASVDSASQHPLPVETVDDVESNDVVGSGLAGEGGVTSASVMPRTDQVSGASDNVRAPRAYETAPYASTSARFETIQLAVDRRMLVNRKEQKQMYRCWMQAKFRKL
ncbi:unnamed protein product [Parajaminaea phylloscopi]